MIFFSSFGFEPAAPRLHEVFKGILAPTGRRVERCFAVMENPIETPGFDGHQLIYGGVPSDEAIENSRAILDRELRLHIGEPLRWPELRRRVAAWWPIPHFVLDIEHNLAARWEDASEPVRASWIAQRRALGHGPESDKPSYEAAAMRWIAVMLGVMQQWGCAGLYDSSKIRAWPNNDPLDDMPGDSMAKCAELLRLTDFAYVSGDDDWPEKDWIFAWDTSVAKKKIRMAQTCLYDPRGVLQTDDQIEKAYRTRLKHGLAHVLWIPPGRVKAEPGKVEQDLVEYALALRDAIRKGA